MLKRLVRCDRRLLSVGATVRWRVTLLEDVGAHRVDRGSSSRGGRGPLRIDAPADSRSHRIQVLDLIGRKAAGEEFELPAPTGEKPPVVDLMAALEASVEAAKEARKRHPTARTKLAAYAKAPAKARTRARKSA
jgi:hypothetical protein